MSITLGIRREDKNIWEKRVPIIPDHVKELKEKHGIKTIIQPSKIRIFDDEEYHDVKAKVDENLNDANVVFAVKEIPIDFFEKNKTYIFFAHVTKGQEHNMPMLKKMMDLGCNLIDYEKITDEKNRRLVFFGRYAGLAGMVDTLWAFGQRIKYNKIITPLNEIKQSIYYNGIDEIKNHFRKIGKKIQKHGLPNDISPIVVGFTGYGNVSKGAQEILDILPIKEINPKELEAMDKNFSNKVIYKVVFKEEDTVESVLSNKKFDLQEYYSNPELYHSVFHRYIPYLSILMNCIYWEERYPRLITKKFIKEQYSKKIKLQIIGDISVDINGAIEFTSKTTSTSNPVFVYNPITDNITDNCKDDGIVVMAVDNLPCELPKESSIEFSNTLLSYIPNIVKADFSTDFNSLDLPSEIKKAVILYQGKLTPNYKYISKFL
ncbi:MAG: bifunctional lysine ketoglutarate reductase /saccharopine dehydrogenase family protein [Epsilonproteobacteria bacterium]|nr:bifunctional lysine ketoglutarate reductase /saccharopine dehydrogenase family protein [Campylobacterota bacterium]